AARACDISGDSQAAQSHLEAAGVVAPGISEVTDRIAALDDRTRGEALLAEGDAKSALAVFVAALKRDPEDPLTHLGIGEALKMLGDAARAQQSIDRALKLAPSLPGRPE
ncbi:MAG TPA: tetratricopeptide repeat protein, partial [Candidatus Hydrogenedentes bacterium]|nr:tetratricopeptide repeat protein [Candidatus Hydrogenedentota bacterium]